MLARRPFKQPAKPDRAPRVWPGKQEFAPAARCDGLGVAQPKGEKAKPGKRTPNAEERRWMDFIVAFGCIACRLDGMGYRPPAVHHILRGGVRMGHLFTLPLCDPGHHQGGQALGLISRHPWKQQFEQRYGTEQALLEILQKAYAALDTRTQPAIKPIAN